MWLPRFICPECHAALDGVDGGADRVVCAACGRRFGRVNGVWQLLTTERAHALAPFIAQYRDVRAREGRRRFPAMYYRALPVVPERDPNADEWRIRQETYRHLLGHVFAAGKHPSTVLDLGAGCGWLSHRLSRHGHHVVAVDARDEIEDGLGAVQHYETPIVAIRADFDAIPLAPRQFDVVVFNGSLHYAPDAAATLARAHRLLDAGGTLVVMDSPMFRAAADGAAMVADTVRRFARQYGLREIVQPGAGYLTFSSLVAAANTFNMAAEFVPSRGPFAWRLRRSLSRLRLGRQPAAFGLWVAR